MLGKVVHPNLSRVGLAKPLHIWTEPSSPSKVDRGVYPEPCGSRLWDWVHEAVKGGASTQTVVVSFGILRHWGRWQPNVHHCGELWAGEPCSVDHSVAREGHGCCPTNNDGQATTRGGGRIGRQNGGLQNDRAAIVFDVAVEPKHERVRVHNPGRRREQRAGAVHLGFQFGHRFNRKILKITHTVCSSCTVDGIELVVLRTVSRYNQLAAALVWDSTLARIAIQQVSAADAHLGLERIWTVVDAGMHHLGVPRRRSRPYQRCCLEYNHLAATQGQLPSNREANHTCANHNRLNTVHIRSGPPGAGLLKRSPR
eukprot:m.103784 g.103784  ORF g.103784 m.103784 type:complete len:312 (-) comp20893_c0_seq1:227-1162(-)